MKAALLGAGEPHFSGHLKTLQVIPEIETITVWGDNPEALAALQGEEKVARLHDSLDSLLAEEDIFFAIATMRNDLKPAIFTRLLDAGLHLMAEKPIATTAAAVQDLVTQAATAGLVLGTCYQNRYHPLIQDARRMVAEDVVGDLMSIEMRMLTTQPKFRAPDSWMFRRDFAGGGMLAWLGCHYIDLIRYLSGDEIISVSAEVATRSGVDIDVEDVAILSLRLRSGALASLHTGYTLSLKGEAYGTTPSYDTYIGINGRHGRIYWDAEGVPDRLYVESTQAEQATTPVRSCDYKVGQSSAYGGVHGENFLRDFIRAAQGKAVVPASGKDALQVARVIDAAYESSRTGRRIDIEAP